MQVEIITDLCIQILTIAYACVAQAPNLQMPRAHGSPAEPSRPATKKEGGDDPTHLGRHARERRGARRCAPVLPWREGGELVRP